MEVLTVGKFWNAISDTIFRPPANESTFISIVWIKQKNTYKKIYYLHQSFIYRMFEMYNRYRIFPIM